MITGGKDATTDDAQMRKIRRLVKEDDERQQVPRLISPLNHFLIQYVEISLFYGQFCIVMFNIRP